MILLIVYLVLCFLFLAFMAFANCAETAYTSASATWMKEKADAGSPAAKIALGYIENPQRFLVTALLNCNLWNVSLVTVAQTVVAVYVVNTPTFQKFLHSVGASANTRWDELLTSVVVTAICLIFAEITPKAIARAQANRVALFLAYPMHWSDRILCRVLPVGLLIKASDAIIHMAGINTSRKNQLTPDDLRAIAVSLKEQGTVKEDVGDMLQSALELHERSVTTIMVPLNELKYVNTNVTLGKFQEICAEHGYQWLPVFLGHEMNDFEILGFIHLRKVITATMENPKLLQSTLADVYISSDLIDDQILYVPDSMTLKEMSFQFSSQENTKPVCVVDEFGGLRGIVTQEDLVLSIAGWVNNSKLKQHYSQINRLSPTTFECDARIDIREIEDELQCPIHCEFVSAAGLVISLAGRLPEEGEEFSTQDFSVRVIRRNARNLSRLRFTRTRPSKNEKKSK